MKKLSAKILVVEDDALTREMIRKLLENAQYEVIEAEDGAAALGVVNDGQITLAILDVTMPKMGGLAALQTLRERGFTFPVLMLSGHGEVYDRLRGLHLGADDYMGKPFDPRELVARVAALLRRAGTSAPAPRTLRRNDVWIDLLAKRAERAGRALSLTATEFAILDVLAQHAGRPVSRERLLDLVWGYTSASTTRTVETHIWRLRKKIGDSADDSGWIRNVQGAGYVLSASLEETPGELATAGQSKK